ncbi:hypothetical protein NEHOM01_0832 [Nematocida homosporus]|uniref:uncharacterized protein n=1 Tax=Nematocida homosporus TaxID=1912981 RepID=UPI00222127CE|nr:uncharacterized protein NEHOM01_0832 [Nematocida homosporus]KAI5185417.1 hypothetical protein NEHOM01_0832 [Nematocida homosporus]
MERDKKRVVAIGKEKIDVVDLLGRPYGAWLQLVSGGIEVVERPTGLGEVSKVEWRRMLKQRVFWIERPSLVGLAAMYGVKGTRLVSHEALAQILLASVGASQVAVWDDHHALVLAAVAQGRGGVSGLFRIAPSSLAQTPVHTLSALGYPAVLPAYSVQSFTSSGRGLIVLAPRDALDYSVVLEFLTSSLAYQTDFLFYHSCKEALLPLFNGLMQESRAGLLELREVFSRAYQTRTGAIHPAMTKEDHSGFILSGTFLNTGFFQI